MRSRGPAALPTVALEADVIAEPDTGLPSRIRGTMRVTGWQTDGRGHCLYLPYLDPEYGETQGAARRYEVFTDSRVRRAFSGGSTSLLDAPLPSGHVVRLELPPGATDATISFDSIVPRIAGSQTNDWFFDGFHPELLTSCSGDGHDALALELKSRIKIPVEWNHAGLGSLLDGGFLVSSLTGRGTVFSLSRNLKRLAFTVGKLPVELVYASDSFTELQPTIEALLPRLQQILGPFPFPSLTIVETTELQRSGLPGLIALNKPAQALFDTAQADWLNWRHWIVATQMAQQWYGAAIAATSLDDEWLTTGIAEFATLEALRAYPRRYDLFNPAGDGDYFLTFTYLQIQEIQAATLRRASPFARLTTPALQSQEPYSDQPALLYSRHAIAMRQLMSYAGEASFFGFTRNLTAAFLHRHISPGDFQRFLTRLPSPFSPVIRSELSEQLTKWWTLEGWPDFALDEMKTEKLPDGRWMTRVTARQEGSIDFPPTIGVEDENKKRYVARAAKQGDLWQAEIITETEPQSALVDPFHESFDENRFNNRAGFPRLTFFPGSANTLADDAYTVIWAPYAFRRPGEPFAFGLQAAGFRFVQGGLFLKVETAPSEELTAVAVRQRYQIPSWALHGDFAVEQDFEKARLAEATLVRAPLLRFGPHLSLNLRARHREKAGEPDSKHETVVIGFGMKPSGAPSACAYNLMAELERAPKGLARGFQYERKLGAVSGDCRLFGTRATLGARAFAGALWQEGTPPDTVLFRPTDLREARLRIDTPGLARATKITSLGVDLGLPFYLPLPRDSLILTRQMRWRLFHDTGRAFAPHADYRSAGLGFTLPFGGDLSGAGSLSLTRLSVLAILYSSVDRSVSRKPSVVFDLTGEL